MELFFYVKIHAVVIEAVGISSALNIPDPLWSRSGKFPNIALKSRLDIDRWSQVTIFCQCAQLQPAINITIMPLSRAYESSAVGALCVLKDLVCRTVVNDCIIPSYIPRVLQLTILLHPQLDTIDIIVYTSMPPLYFVSFCIIPDSKVHWANMGPMNLAIRDSCLNALRKFCGSKRVALSIP